ncbi:MAG: FMN-binding negative transcriptional regulator [Betaproteobacteria bacterium]
MYMPPQFNAKDREQAQELMRAQPFASLIGSDDEGTPFVSHIPLHLDDRTASTPDAQRDWVLLGHVAKANPHWRYLQARPRALVTFMGPHAFMSTRVYPDLARVPTWNYLAVHCTVTATLVDDVVAKDALLKKLIADHDPGYAEQWRGLGEEYAHKMLAGIVGFELRVIDVQCKIKINQHRPESHQRLREVYAAGNEHERALGQWMDRLGMGQAVPTGAGAA